jgi:hypothetical protein
MVIDCCSVDFLANGWMTIPKFLEENKWQSSASIADSPMTKALGNKEGTTFWDLLGAHEAAPAFMEYMGCFNDGHKEWTDIYPIVERLGQGASAEPDAVFMVDVGGGQGHQAINCKKRFPQLPGKFVVQDLAMSMPAEDQRTKEVEFQVHDFTTEQPVKGMYPTLGMSRVGCSRLIIASYRRPTILSPLRPARLAAGVQRPTLHAASQGHEARLLEAHRE